MIFDKKKIETTLKIMDALSECHSIIENIISMQRFEISSVRRNSLFLLASEIKEWNRIDNYTNLINYLSSL